MSALAQEVARVSPVVVDRMHLRPGLLAVWRALVAACEVIVDDQAGWTREQRFDAAVGAIEASVSATEAADLEVLCDELKRLVEEDQITKWAADLRRQDFRTWLERAVGGAAYLRLQRAFYADLALVIKVIRKGSAILLPYAAALEDMLTVSGGVTFVQAGLDPATQSLLGFVLRIDRVLEGAIEAAFSEEFPTAELFSSAPVPTGDELLALLPQLRAVISGRSSDLAQSLGVMVTRKLKGARDAIAMSADPVSQGANSLIEMIDRMLRTAFSDDEVMLWLAVNYPEDPTLAWSDQAGGQRPTKRGQARCFVNAGGPIPEQPEALELLADVLVKARGALQGLKHADTGTAEELDDLVRLMCAIEGFFAFSVGLLWGTLPDEAVERVLARLSPQFGDAEGPDRSSRAGGTRQAS